jgi:hypothetical protein
MVHFFSHGSHGIPQKLKNYSLSRPPHLQFVVCSPAYYSNPLPLLAALSPQWQQSRTQFTLCSSTIPVFQLQIFYLKSRSLLPQISPRLVSPGSFERSPPNQVELVTAISTLRLIILISTIGHVTRCPLKPSPPIMKHGSLEASNSSLLPIGTFFFPHKLCGTPRKLILVTFLTSQFTARLLPPSHCEMPCLLRGALLTPAVAIPL